MRFSGLISPNSFIVMYNCPEGFLKGIEELLGLMIAGRKGK